MVEKLINAELVAWEVHQKQFRIDEHKNYYYWKLKPCKESIWSDYNSYEPIIIILIGHVISCANINISNHFRRKISLIEIPILLSEPLCGYLFYYSLVFCANFAFPFYSFILKRGNICLNKHSVWWREKKEQEITTVISEKKKICNEIIIIQFDKMKPATR